MCSHHRFTSHGRCGCDAGALAPSHHVEHHHYPGPGFSGGLGVRRPLRFLGWKLGLNEAQVTEFATVLNALKTERAQAEVDGRRAVTALADAIAGEAFDQQKATEGATIRVRSAEGLRDMLVQSLARIHAVLKPEQRARLAYLIRTGTLSL